MLTRLAAVVLWGVASAGAALAQAGPSSLPARDAHAGVLIAANPYRDAERYKARFGKRNPYDAGILALEVFFRNDNEKPIRVDLESIRLLLDPTGSARQRLEPLAVEDVVDRILNMGGPNPTVPRRPIPRRGPKSGRSKEWKELEAALREVAFRNDVLPPLSSVRGFLFFDINHRYDWLPYARLYVPDVKFLESKQALLFFELDLRAAVPH